jgi:plasmid stabilization system protein ParE
MTPLSAAAQAALEELTDFYAARGRDRAIDKLAACVEAACRRYPAKRNSFYPAPRPYPQLADLGFRWTKEGPYWIAFAETADGPVLVGVFHEAADIPKRI